MFARVNLRVSWCLIDVKLGVKMKMMMMVVMICKVREDDGQEDFRKLHRLTWAGS